jgi:hypothetical protein
LSEPICYLSFGFGIVGTIDLPFDEEVAL